MAPAASRSARILVLLAVASSVWVASPARAKPGERAPAVDVALTDEAMDVGTLGEGQVAHSPSMVAYGDGALLAFRLDTPHEDGQADSQIAVVALDAAFARLQEPVVLDLRSQAQEHHTAADPKLVWLDDQLLLVFHQPVGTKKDAPRRMHVARLRVEGGQDRREPLTAALERFARISPPHGVRSHLVERGWTPFVHEGLLWLLYRDNPPIAIGVDAGSLIAGGEGLDTFGPIAEAPRVHFTGGTWKGGTPAVASAPDGSYETFFTVFDRVGQKSYATLGYATFEPEPPFALRALVPASLVVPDLEVDSTRSVSHAIAGGFLRRGHSLYVVYGRHDRAIHLLTLDAEQLALHLVPTASPEEFVP